MTNQAPRVVIFDLGKVLVDFDYAIAARRIAAKAKLSAGEVQNVIEGSPLLFRFETGQISSTEFFDEVCRATGYRDSQQEFEPEFSDIFSAIEPIIALHEKLRRLKMPTFILSNTNDLAVAHIRRKFPFFSNFDGYILSFEQRSMKPSERIYEIAEKITGAREADILYIDDRLENLQPAKRLGWNVVHHQDMDVTLDVFQKFGLVPKERASRSD